MGIEMLLYPPEFIRKPISEETVSKVDIAWYIQENRECFVETRCQK